MTNNEMMNMMNAMMSTMAKFMTDSMMNGNVSTPKAPVEKKPQDFINSDDKIFSLKFNKNFVPAFASDYKDTKTHGIVLTVPGRINKEAAVDPKAVCDSEVLFVKGGIKLGNKYLTAAQVKDMVGSGKISLVLKSRGNSVIEHGNKSNEKDWTVDKNGNRYLKTSRKSFDCVVEAVKNF